MHMYPLLLRKGKQKRTRGCFKSLTTILAIFLLAIREFATQVRNEDTKRLPCLPLSCGLCLAP